MKKHCFNKIFIILFAFISFCDLNGQQPEILITGNFDRVPLPSFLQKIEKEYQVDFFYAEKAIAEVRVTGDFSRVPLIACLSKILADTRIRFFISGNRQVVLYSGNVLSDLFPGTDLNLPVQDQNPTGKKISSESLQQLQYQIINIGSPGYNKNKSGTLYGYLKNFETGLPIAGGNIYVTETQKGVSSDAAGYYKISLPPGNQIVNFSCIGMVPTTRNINMYSDGRLDVELEVKMTMLKGAEIIGQGEGNVGKMHIGMEKIDIMSVKSIPTLLGESDVIKSVLTMPGVQTVGEGTAGFNVRGGSTDQNLILIDRATLYYPSHFFGNFSAINSEIIESATLYKGSIPVNYGGRISSVFELNTIDGNKERISGSAGISPIYARMNIDGPLFSEKSSFLTSFRTTYSDWLLSNINVPELSNSTAGFYDIQGKLDIYLNSKNRLFVNFYSSTDRFKLHSDTSYKYKNTIGSLILKHKFSSGMTLGTSLICSLFNYRIADESSVDKAFNLMHHLSNISFINDFEYKTSSSMKFIYGAEFNFYTINPGERRPIGNSNISPVYTDNERALEYGIYGGADFNLSARLRIETGVRLSGLLSFDDGRKYIYADNMPFESENITDTLLTDRNKIQKTYINPEWRISLNYSTGSFSSVKFSYNKTAQYIHMISNTAAISPTDTWKLSDAYILPETGNQFSAGYFKTFARKRIEISGEIFYKLVNNIKQYKAGADLLLNDHIETEIINGKGKSYGVEFSIEKSAGRIYGRIDYTYSRTLIRSVSEFSGELINGGEYFPANYDKPHNLNILATIRTSRRLFISTGIYYSTGRPVTYPVSKYMLGDQIFMLYSDYNKYRISDYFRTDLSLTVNGNLKKKKLVRSSMTFSLYNVTARKNAYSVYFKSEDGKFNAYQLSIFGTIIPTITYNMDF